MHSNPKLRTHPVRFCPELLELLCRRSGSQQPGNPLRLGNVLLRLCDLGGDLRIFVPNGEFKLASAPNQSIDLSAHPGEVRICLRLLLDRSRDPHLTNRIRTIVVAVKFRLPKCDSHSVTLRTNSSPMSTPVARPCETPDLGCQARTQQCTRFRLSSGVQLRRQDAALCDR